MPAMPIASASASATSAASATSVASTAAAVSAMTADTDVFNDVLAFAAMRRPKQVLECQHLATTLQGPQTLVLARGAFTTVGRCGEHVMYVMNEQEIEMARLARLAIQRGSTSSSPDVQDALHEFIASLDSATIDKIMKTAESALRSRQRMPAVSFSKSARGASKVAIQGGYLKKKSFTKSCCGSRVEGSR
jgi:hypothetical protein